MSIPFTANYSTFTDALMQAKRASQLRGIPFSTADVQNLQSGYMASAFERTAGERSATLAEKAQTAQEKNWADTLAQEKELAGLSRTQAAQLTGMQIDAQKTAANKALTGKIVSTGLGIGGAAWLLAPKVTIDAAALAAGKLTAAQAATLGGPAAPTLEAMGGGAEGVMVPGAATAPAWLAPAAIAAGAYGLSKVGQNNLDYGGNEFEKHWP